MLRFRCSAQRRGAWRLVVAALAGLLLATACAATAAEPDTDAAPAVEPSRAVYQVVAAACGTGIEGLATGVAVAEDRLVTVAHTFEGAAGVEVADIDGHRQPVEVVWLDARRDIAVLALSEGPGLFLPLGQAADGDDVSVITSAAGITETKPATILRHVDLTLDGDGQRAGMELQADIDPGDSGAPVIGLDGDVVGIVFATDRTDPRGWAISAREIETALTNQGDPIALDC